MVTFSPSSSTTEKTRGLRVSRSLIMFPLRFIGLPGRDDAHRVARALGVNDEEQPPARQADDEKSGLFLRVLRVVIFERVRVVEDLRGLAEADAVLLQVGLRLLIVPLEYHRARRPPLRFMVRVAFIRPLLNPHLSVSSGLKPEMDREGP